jgi:Leucine-rich repeat (LRR) protein
MKRLLLIPLVLFVGLALGQNCTADDGTDGVELWGECYSIENTTEILLPSSGLTGEIPETIGNLINLNNLVLYNNQLIGTVPESITNLNNLTWLNLYNNQLTGELPHDIGDLTNLTTLDLGFNQFTGEIPVSLGDLINLNHLWLFNNQLNGEIPPSICNIYQNLEHYFIYNNQLCPPYPDCLSEEDIGYQDTTDCSSCEEGEVMLWNECYSIEYTTELDLSYNGVTGEISPEIGNLTNLTSLILKENQLYGGIPPEIGNLTSLTDLDLGGNLLTGEIPSEISYLTNLTILDLGGNQFYGEIPPEMCNLTNLTELELGGNLLTGEIPPEIYNLVNLTFLHLEYNQITGSIPYQIGNLSTLIWLNFVHNQLTGEIPSSICELDINWSSPDNFNINYNQICPPYPSCVEEYVGEQDTTNCSQGNITVDYQSDWNLVGLPLEVENASYTYLFSESIEGTLYSFDYGYYIETSLIHGEGYWLRFNAEGSTTISGTPINELTISLNEGWNLISGISIPLDVTQIQDPDEIIIAGTVYEFASGGYSNEEILEPGKGYWIRANSSGSIILIDN